MIYKVSTITPCFKMKAYLKDFLEDLPNQTYFDNLEVILDHNEPDEEELVWVKEFNNKYPGKIKHIVINKVDPIGVSMNRCIRESTGDLLTIWNVDDLRTPDSIESQVESIIKDNSDVCIGDYYIVRKFKSKFGKLIKHRKIDKSEFKRSMVLGPFFMFKKELCEKIGYFDEQLKSGADFDLAIRIGYHAKISISDEILGYYLNEGKGASTRPNSKQLTERTVIELRYGIFDKINLHQIPHTVNYDIPHIISFNNKISVFKYIPEYEKILEINSNQIYKSVINTFITETIGITNIKNKVKNLIKKHLIK